MLVFVWVVFSDLHLFHFIVLPNPDFNCSIVSVILNVAFLGALIAGLACFSCNIYFIFKRFRICYRVCIIIITKNVRFITVIIPQTTCSFCIIFTVFNQIYTGIATSISSPFSINTPFILEMQSINTALLLDAKTLFLTSIKSLSAVFAREISALTTIYASL